MRDMPSNGDDVGGIVVGNGVPGVLAAGSGCKCPGRHPAFVGLLHPVFCYLIDLLCYTKITKTQTEDTE